MTNELPQNVKRLPIKASRHVALTERIVEEALPRQKDYFLRDENLIGFGVRVNPAGSKTYFVEARLRGTGRPLRRSVGHAERLSLKEARLIAKDLLKQISQGVDPKEVEDERRAKEMTIKELIEHYYTHNQNIKDSRRGQYIQEAHSFLKPLLNIPAAELSEFRYQKFYRTHVDITPWNTDKIHRQLKAAYNYAISKKLVELNPTQIIQKRDKPTLRPRRQFIDLEIELAPFIQALVFESIRPAARDAMLLLLSTGMRKEEVLALRWDELDFNKFLIIKQDTKNKHTHYVPMSHLVRAILVSRSKDEKKHGVYVFSNKKGESHISDLRKPMARVLKAAGINKEIRLHDLRRTFTTLAQEEGLTEIEVESLLNHAPSSVAQKSYMIEAAPKMLKRRRDILNAISKRLEEEATRTSHGIRMGLYRNGMFEEEQTEDGSIEYEYWDAFTYEQLQNKELSITHEDFAALHPHLASKRNLLLERVYSG